MALFDIPARAGKEADNRIAKKANTKVRQTATVKGGSSLIVASMMPRVSRIEMRLPVPFQPVFTR